MSFDNCISVHERYNIYKKKRNQYYYYKFFIFIYQKYLHSISIKFVR